MWYIKSGQLEGISEQESMIDAFVELFDSWIKQTGHFPDLGILGVGSTESFEYTPTGSFFFLTEWLLFETGRIPKMSHGFENAHEHMLSLFDEGLPDAQKAWRIVNAGQDEILSASVIDAPNSREDYWDDTIDVPENYQFNVRCVD